MLPVSFAVAVALASRPAPLPDGAVCRLGTHTFRGPATDGFAFSPDGKHLLAPTSAAEPVRQRFEIAKVEGKPIPAPAVGAYVWDVETGRRLPDLHCPPADTKHTSFTSVIAGGRVFRATADRFSPHPPELLVGSLADGKQTLRLELPYYLTFNPEPHAHQTACVSADGTRVAFDNTNQRETEVWDLETKQRVGVINTYANTHTDLSPTGDTFVSLDSKMRVWAVATGKATASFTRDGRYVRLRVSDGGKWVVSMFWSRPTFQPGRPPASPDWSTVLVTDVAGGKEDKLDVGCFALDVRPVGADGLIVYGLRQTDNGGLVGVIARWDLATHKKGWETEYTVAIGPDKPDRWGRPQPPERDARLAVSADGKRVAVSDRGPAIAVFDAATGKRIAAPTAHESGVRAVGYSADGKTVVTIGEFDVRAWDAITGELKRGEFPPDLRPARVELIAGGVAVFTRPTKAETEVIAWDAVGGKPAWRFTADLATVSRTLSPDGKRVVLFGRERGSLGDRVAVFDGPTGKLEHGRAFTNNDWSQSPLVVSADGRRLWAALDLTRKDDPRTSLGSCRLADGGDAREVVVAVDTRRKADSPVKQPFAVAPDESAAVLIDADNAVWVTTLGEKPKTTQFVAGGLRPTAMVFSPDSKRVALLDHRTSEVGVLDVTKGDGIRPQLLDAGGAKATAVAFSPDGTRLAVGYADGTAVVWKVK